MNYSLLTLWSSVIYILVTSYIKKLSRDNYIMEILTCCGRQTKKRNHKYFTHLENICEQIIHNRF